MTAFVANNGAVNNFDGYSGGSVNATLDSYAISAGSTLLVRTDTYACPNHSAAFGSVDTVTFSGQGGTLKFDPTYTREVSHTGGSGTVPAYGTTISQGGVSGVFLGVWANWLSEPVAPGGTVPATGYIKIGGITGGAFAAGALTGITATCSGADRQSWIEARGADTAQITVPRIGKVETVEAYYEIGTTSGTAGQIIACPTCATLASTFPGCFIETAPGSGVYDEFPSVGTVVALATHRTDASMKVCTQTTGGIRLGNDGTNNVFFLPPAGCKVRIPATLWTCCTRTAGSGSGPRVLPNATLATRQEFVTTGAGYFDLRGVMSQWYLNFTQAYYVKVKGCAISDTLVLSEIAAPLDVQDSLVGVTQAQLNLALNIASCFAGGLVSGNAFNRFSLAASGAYVASINYATGVTFSANAYRSGTLRGNATTGCITSTQAKNCTFDGETLIGGRGLMVGPQGCTFKNTKYYDHTITTTTSATNPMSAWEFTTGGSGNVVEGFSLPLPANGPYTALVTLNACYSSLIKLIGSYASKLTLNASVTGVLVNGTGNNDGVTIKQAYAINTRSAPYAFVNSDTNILVEHVYGDYADTSVMAGLNATVKNCGLTGATTGQVSVYGAHWQTRFTSTTAGFLEITCNEPTVASAAQCAITGGDPQFNSSGSLLATKVGDQVTWETDWFVKGYTAFTNSAPTITGTNVTYSSGARWGNHDLEFQIDTGSGYGGTWLALTAANLIAQSISAVSGFKLKLRATCATANAGNVLTNLRVAMTTTDAAQGTNLYPLSVVTMQFTGLPTGCDITVIAAGTETVRENTEDYAGTTYNYTYADPGAAVDIVIIKPGYMPAAVRNYTLSSSAASLPFALTPDPSYLE
jgi:hypothetical protein